MISEEEIQETFYNVMINVALESKIENLDECIKPLMVRTLSSVCNSATTIHLADMSKSFGFVTLRGNIITRDNVSEEYKILFDSLITAMNNRTNSSVYVVILNKLIDEVIKKDTFSTIISNFKQFYTETNKEKDIQVSVEGIRDTFYNIMVDQYFLNMSVLKDGIENQDSYIFLCLSAYSITAILRLSVGTYGIKLCNGAVVTKSNCPNEYKTLFDKLFNLKQIFDELNPNEKTIELINMVTSSNPDIVISEEFMQLRTDSVNKIISYISGLSIEISKIKHFKEIIGEVLKFCLEL
jgi:hypothetical protein